MRSQTSSNTLGIDFGTSNSAAGVMVNGRPHLIDMEAGQKTMPTSVFFDFEKQKILFGSPANSALIQGHEGRFMRSLKSVLGTSLMHESRMMMGQRLTFVDIISKFISELKSRAETACYQEFDYALSGRPVHFHSNNPDKDRKALEDLTECYLKAGFKDVRFMHEPEAAAIANGALERQSTIGLIVDIGGGTSDFAIFRNQSDAHDIEILASHGVRVGGTNFDKSISVDHVMPLLGKGSQIKNEMGSGTHATPNGLFQDLATWEKIPFLYTADARRNVSQMCRQAVEKPLLSRLETVLEHELGHEILFEVEQGKININKGLQDQSKVNLDFVERGLAATVSQSDLAQSLAGHADKIQLCAKETLTMANLNANQIDTVIFVGGSSLMSVVEEAMTTLFQSAKFHRAEAFTAVVSGLTIACSEAG